MTEDKPFEGVVPDDAVASSAADISKFDTSVAHPARIYNQNVATHQTLRNRAEVARFFEGLEVLEPGLVQWHRWRPEAADAAPDDFKSGHCGVARKP